MTATRGTGWIHAELRVLFRVDSAGHIGLGHLSRCMALGECLRERRAQVSFALQSRDPSILARIRAGNFPVHLLPADISLTQDANETAAQALRERVHTVVVDSYAIDEAYQRMVKDAGLGLVAIDDHAAHPVYADIVVNQNISATKKVYRALDRTRFLLGPRYALLRKRFAELHLWQKPILARARRIFVSLGGADHENQTLKVVRALTRLKGDLEIDVVIGPLYRDEGMLTATLRTAPWPWALFRDPPNLLALMQQADLAVNAAGTTVWELACLGVPSVVLTIADNQAANAYDLSALGMAVSLGRSQDVGEEDLIETVTQLLDDREHRQAMSHAGKAMVDGLGTGRVAEFIGEVYIARGPDR